MVITEESARFFLVISSRGTTPYEKYCSIPRYQSVQDEEAFDCEFVFMSEGGGFVLDGNPHAEALINHQLQES